MQHTMYTASDLKDAQDSRLFDYVCKAGLSICKVCGLAGGELTTHCPGEPSRERAGDIYTGLIDYVDGQWTSATNPTDAVLAAS